jgi:hypothetical protein
VTGAPTPPRTETEPRFCPRCGHAITAEHRAAEATAAPPLRDEGIERRPHPDVVSRIARHLLGEDIVNIRAAIEAFPNGYTVVPKAEATAAPPLARCGRTDTVTTVEGRQLLFRCDREPSHGGRHHAANVEGVELSWATAAPLLLDLDDPIVKALNYPCSEPIHREAQRALAALRSQPTDSEGSR